MTRSSRMDVGYFGPQPIAPGDGFLKRAAQRAASERRMRMIANNVGELIEILKKFNPEGRIYTIEPPFDGVKLVAQGDGAVLICRPREPQQLNREAQ